MGLPDALDVPLAVRAFTPASLPGLGLWLRHDMGITTDATAFAGAGTVTIAAGVATFTSSQDGVLQVGAIVTVGVDAHTVVSRTSGTIWNVTGADAAALSAFTVTMPYPRVTAWADQSGNGRHFAQATATSQPLYQPDQGLSAPYFDGTNDLLSGNAASLNLTRNLPGFTLFHVIRYVGSPDTTRRMGFWASNNAAAARVTLEKTATDTNSTGNRRLDADGSQAVSGVSVPATRIIQCARFQYTATTLRGYMNGTQFAASTSFQTAGSTSDTDSGTVGIGGQGTGVGTLPMVGPIFSVLAYQRALTDLEKIQVTQYLGRQYAIAVTNG